MTVNDPKSAKMYKNIQQHPKMSQNIPKLDQNSPKTSHNVPKHIKMSQNVQKCLKCLKSLKTFQNVLKCANSKQ